MAKPQSLQNMHSPAKLAVASTTGTTAATPDEVEVLQTQLLMVMHLDRVLTGLVWVLAVVMMLAPVGLALDEFHVALDRSGPLNKYHVSALAVLVGWLALPLLNSMASKARHQVVDMNKQLQALKPETAAALLDVKKPARNRRL